MAPSKSASTSAEDSISILSWAAESVESSADVVSEYSKLGVAGSVTSEIVSAIFFSVLVVASLLL